MRSRYDLIWVDKIYVGSVRLTKRKKEFKAKKFYTLFAYRTLDKIKGIPKCMLSLIEIQNFSGPSTNGASAVRQTSSKTEKKEIKSNKNCNRKESGKWVPSVIITNLCKRKCSFFQ